MDIWWMMNWKINTTESKEIEALQEKEHKNLKYIQKELKLKKNRSDQEKAKPNPPDFRA